MSRKTRGYPQSAKAERILYGFPPNLVHAESPYGSLFPRLAQRSYRALYRLLYGKELPDDSPATITVGHRHDEDEFAALPWMQIASWRPVGGENIEMDGGGGHYLIGGTIVDWSVEADVGGFGFVVPSGATKVYPKVRVSVSGRQHIGVHLRFYQRASPGAASPVIDAGTLGVEEESLASSIENEWRHWGGGIDITALDTEHNVRTGWCRVSAYVSGSGTLQAGLWEVALGLRRGP